MLDSTMAVIIDERDKGQFPISIGTSLAIEGALGIQPADSPDAGKANAVKLSDIPYTKYDEIWFNVRTLFRNAMGAIKKEDEIRMSPDNYATLIEEEIRIIRAALQQNTGTKLMPVFYVCDYNSLNKRYRHATFKEVKTDRQKHYASMENLTLGILFKKMEENQLFIYHFDTDVKGHGRAAMFVTHYPIDLLSADNFKEIALVESHTGVVKTKELWYTKLKDGKNLTRIPFDKMTIQMFGDSGGLIAPQPLEFRNKLLEIAEHYKWTPVTTEERIRLTVKLSRAPTLEGAIMKMYSSVL